VRQGEIDPNEFFTFLDVTAEVAKVYGGIGGQIDDMRQTICSEKCPDVQIGKQCDSPYTCALHDRCWSFLPARNVFELYGDRKGRRWDLFQKSILRIAEIPADYSLSAKQGIQRTTVTSGKPHVSRDAIQTFLNNLQYPLHFLDFETFSTAIPIFDGTSPYQQIPFQFSVHVVHEAGAVPEHRKYLADGRNDPRAEFMRNLKAAIEPVGSVLAFNAAFEKSRMKECAVVLSEHASWVEAVNQRVVDLLNPFRAFHYYHPYQNGSASMKSVLPALTGKDYTGLEIQEGNAASREFLRVTFGDVSESERKRVRQALDLYCGRDTQGMVWILDALKRALEVESAAPTSV
jgi:hypothetical protein